MPIYRNPDATKTKRVRGLELEPGQSGAPMPDRYLTPDELSRSGLVLAHPNVSPLPKIAEGTPAFTVASGLAVYGKLVITNDTDDSISVLFNGDVMSPFTIVAGAMYSITTDRQIDAIQVTGSGSGSAYLHGIFTSQL